MQASGQSEDNLVPILISVGYSSSNDDLNSQVQESQHQLNDHAPDRSADVVDLLGVVAKRTWVDAEPPDRTEYAFRSTLVGTEGLNSITAPIRTLKGDTVVFKTLNAVERDGLQMFNLDQIFRELSVLNFLRNDAAVARFRKIVWEVRGSAENLTILPAIETERAISDLADFCRDRPKASLETRLRLCQDVIEGLRNAHYWKICHGDVKPQNILVYPNKYRGVRAKLTDFGHSQFQHQEKVRMRGTRFWRAPEWKNELSFDDGLRTDIFGYGLTFWFGVLTFNPWEDLAVIRDILEKVEVSVITEAAGRDQNLSIDEQVEKLQSSSQFPAVALSYASMRVRLSDSERETIETVLESSLCQSDKRNLDPAYRALLHHPWRDSSRRRSQDNPRGSKYLIYGVGPKLDGEPGDFGVPTIAEHAIPLYNSRIDLDFQLLRNEPPTVKRLIFKNLESIESNCNQTVQRRSDASFSLGICYQQGFGCDASVPDSLSCITRAAGLGHEAASSVVKRLHDSAAAAFPKKLDLEVCLKLGIQSGSALAEQEFCSSWPTRTEEISRIRQEEWVNTHHLDKNTIERQFWDSNGNLLPAYTESAQEENADDSLSIGVPSTTLLHYLAVTGESAKLECLLKESALAASLINFADSEEQTPIVAACMYGQFDVFKVLLGHDAPVHRDHWAHDSCLHWISSFQSIEMIEWAVSELATRGADFGARIPFVGSGYYEFYRPRSRRGGVSPLLTAIQCNSIDTLAALLNLLPQSGLVAPFDHRSQGLPSTDDWTANQLLTFRLSWQDEVTDALQECLRTHRTAMARLCIAALNTDDQGTPRATEILDTVLSPVTEFDRRIIHGPEWKREMESCFVLAVESGMRLKHESSEGVSMLHEAVSGSHTDILHFLLTSAAKEFAPDIDCQWEDVWDGMTPLHLALLLGRTAMVRTLLDHGADIHLSSKHSRPLSTLFYYASGQILEDDLFDELLRHLSSAEYLRHSDIADVFAFDAAVGSGRYDLATKLLNRSGGAELEASLLENPQFTVLSKHVFFLQENSWNALHYLLDPPSPFKCPSAMVDESLHMNIVHTLFEGDEFRARDPFYSYQRGDQQPVVKALDMLLQRYTDQGIVDGAETGCGETPLFLAIWTCNPPAVSRLLAHDVRVNHRSTIRLLGLALPGPTPLDLVTSGPWCALLFWTMSIARRERRWTRLQRNLERREEIRQLLIAKGAKTSFELLVETLRSWFLRT